MLLPKTISGNLLKSQRIPNIVLVWHDVHDDNADDDNNEKDEGLA